MRYSEEDLLPISALQHLVFCERQWALIHLEGSWAENRLTAAGRVMHERVHSGEAETRREVRVTRGLALRSLTWGLIGKADVVEFHRVEEGEFQPGEAARLPRRAGWWIPIPVEYKVGKPKLERCDEVQLCAQALCLEEMLGVKVLRGELYYGKTCQRHEVLISEDLRRDTAGAIARLRDLTERKDQPRGRFDQKCQACSLSDLCQPRLAVRGRSVASYVEALFDPRREGGTA